MKPHRNRLLTVLCLSFLSSLYIRAQSGTYAEVMQACQEKLKGASFMAKIKQSQNCVLGAPAPQLEAVTLQGDSVSLHAWRGQVVVINFWFINCRPCRAEIPGLHQIARTYDGKPVQFLALGTDPAPAIRAFLTQNPFGFQHVADAKGVIKNTFRSNWGFPTTIVIGKDGRIREIFNSTKTDDTASQVIQAELVPLIENALAD